MAQFPWKKGNKQPTPPLLDDPERMGRRGLNRRKYLPMQGEGKLPEMSIKSRVYVKPRSYRDA